MQPLISVIVPVYKVEPYLEKCVDSLLNQTYQNCEIILVDDGSPDKCPKICDAYAEKDTRVHVIHKENGGLSDARNKGVAESKGEYITFVDSDDYVTEDYVEYLWKLIETYQADISVGGRYVVNMDGTMRQPSILKEMREDVVLNGHDAVKESCYGKILTVSACAKLYRRNIIESIQFPVGRVYEDLAVACSVVGQSKKTVIGTKKIYYYQMRNDSIIKSSITEKEWQDGNYACDMMRKYVEKNYSDLEGATIYRIVRKKLEYMPVIVAAKEKEKVNRISMEIRPYLWKIIWDRDAALIFKLATFATACGGSISMFMWQWASKKILK